MTQQKFSRCYPTLPKETWEISRILPTFTVFCTATISCFPECIRGTNNQHGRSLVLFPQSAWNRHGKSLDEPRFLIFLRRYVLKHGMIVKEPRGILGCSFCKLLPGALWKWCMTAISLKYTLPQKKCKLPSSRRNSVLRFHWCEMINSEMGFLAGCCHEHCRNDAKPQSHWCTLFSKRKTTKMLCFFWKRVYSKY